MNTNRKHTICIVMGGHFSETIGGAQFQAKCVVEELKKNGNYNIYYLAREINQNYCPDGYKLIKISNMHGLGKYGFIFDTRSLLKLLNDIEPDVIYQRGLKAHTGVIAYYAKKAKCFSIFHIAHDYDVISHNMKGRSRLQWLKWLEKKVGEYGIRNVDSVVAQTQTQASLLLSNYGRNATAVIPNFHPIPTEDLTKIDIPVSVVWVANFKPDKRPEDFVRLASDLACREDLRFVMIGRPGDMSKYSKLHDEIRRLPNLTYMGEQPIEEVNRQLAAGHIFVNTSRAEGFPNTFIQAWMRKVPTISLDVNPDDILSPGKIGYCSYTYDNLRDKVIMLADNAELREHMGEAAQRHAYDMHSPKSAEKLIRIIDGALHE